MKTISKAVASLHSSVARSKRLLAVLLVAVILAPTALRAQGIGDLLLLLHTITSTLQGPIGDALSEMRKMSAAVNNFHQNHLAFGPDQPDEIVCQCNAGALHGPDVSD